MFKRAKHKPVLLPYRFTLLSNEKLDEHTLAIVLLPYRFTLLSNEYAYNPFVVGVLLPYRFTLLSNYTMV